MEAIIIKKEAFSKMKKSFESFLKDITELCQKNESLGKWMDNEEVCRLLDISKRTLQYYRERNIVPFTQMGNKCYYKKSDIEILIKKSTINKKKHERS